MKHPVLFTLLSFFVISTLSACGGSEEDIETDNFEVNFDKNDNSIDLPEITEVSENEVSIQCGDNKTTQNGSVDIICIEAGLYDTFTCSEGQLASDGAGVMGCEEALITCTDGFAVECKSTTDDINTEITEVLEEGNLESSDPTLSDGSYYDIYTISITDGQTVELILESEEFDTFLILLNSSNEVIATNDDWDGSNSYLYQEFDGMSGTFTIVVTSYEGEETGHYTLDIFTY